MKIEPELRFDTPNNAAISLHIMAELARRGELIVISDGAAPATKQKQPSLLKFVEYRFVGLRPCS